MKPKIGIFGSPLEDVPVYGDGIDWIIPAYVPGMSDITRNKVVEIAFEKGLNVYDLGEIKGGPSYTFRKKIDRKKGLYVGDSVDLQWRKLNYLEDARKELLQKQDELDLIVGIGASHLGAMLLYDDNDKVARFDYHSDYLDSFIGQLYYNHATYMNWVDEKIVDADISNFYVLCKEDGILGDEKTLEDYKDEAGFNNFDIDLDCFKTSYKLQDIEVYDFLSGSPEGNVEDVLWMLEQSKPKKLGIWEYREGYDMERKGLDFIIDSIRASSK